MSNRKKPFSPVVVVMGAPAPSSTGAPAPSSRLTVTPARPGLAPSAVLIVPELSRSRQTRLPRLKGRN